MLHYISHVTIFSLFLPNNLRYNRILELLQVLALVKIRSNGIFGKIEYTDQKFFSHLTWSSLTKPLHFILPLHLLGNLEMKGVDTIFYFHFRTNLCQSNFRTFMMSHNISHVTIFTRFLPKNLKYNWILDLLSILALAKFSSNGFARRIEYTRLNYTNILIAWLPMQGWCHHILLTKGFSATWLEALLPSVFN